MDYVHNHFRVWFLWGFINMLGIILQNILSFVRQLKAIALLFWFSVFAQWITGMVWRYRTSGAFASGDELPAGMTEDAWIEKITKKAHGFSTSPAIPFMFT